MIEKLRKDRTERQKWIKKLDSIVTEICQIRDKKKCVMCGSPATHVGHLFRRGLWNTRWDLQNCHLQCDPHNSLHETNRTPYEDWFKSNFIYAHALEYLEKESQIETHFKVFHYKVMYEELKLVRDAYKK